MKCYVEFFYLEQCIALGEDLISKLLDIKLLYTRDSVNKKSKDIKYNIILAIHICILYCDPFMKYSHDQFCLLVDFYKNGEFERYGKFTKTNLLSSYKNLGTRVYESLDSWSKHPVPRFHNTFRDLILKNSNSDGVLISERYLMNFDGAGYLENEIFIRIKPLDDILFSFHYVGFPDRHYTNRLYNKIKRADKFYSTKNENNENKINKMRLRFINLCTKIKAICYEMLQELRISENNYDPGTISTY